MTRDELIKLIEESVDEVMNEASENDVNLKGFSDFGKQKILAYAKENNCSIRDAIQKLGYGRHDAYHRSSAPAPSKINKPELKNMVKECVDEVVDEMYLYEGLFNKKAPIPQDLKISSDDIIKGKPFITKMNKIVKFMEENGYSEKEIGKACSGWYYGIVGTTFGDKTQLNAQYIPKLYVLEDHIAKYPSNKKSIVNDMNNTLKAEGKANVAGEIREKFLKLQKAYMDDLKKALAKLQ